VGASGQEVGGSVSAVAQTSGVHGAELSERRVLGVETVGDPGDAPVNLQVQADAYAAFFETVWRQPWFGGVYWWKWFSDPDDGGTENNDYTPRRKPAELVLQQYFGRVR
jgi:hypothetical protein